MVCVVCNGKGYVSDNGRDRICSECQGRGELFFAGSRNVPKSEIPEQRADQR